MIGIVKFVSEIFLRVFFPPCWNPDSFAAAAGKRRGGRDTVIGPDDMEKLVRSYDKERMKLAMLKHEQTFKEQVYELHRLYRIQKTLMKAFQGGRGDPRRPFAGEEDLYEAGIELTLGLGPTVYDKRSRKRGGTTSPSFCSSTTTGSSRREKSGASCGSEIKGGGAGSAAAVAERMAPQKQHPPWLIEAVLSLNQSSM